MDSPEAAKNTSISTATVNTASSSESPPVQESPFFSYVNTLSPIKPVKASGVAQGFLGLNSPPLVFTSPHINTHRGSQFLERPQCPPSASVEISQNDSKSLLDNSDDFKKASSLLLGKFIIDNPKDFDIKNDANAQHCSSSPCVESVDKYLADPTDIDCMYSGHSVNADVKQSNDKVESSLNDITHSEETIFKFDNKNGPGDKVEEPLLLTEESKKNHQEKSTFVDETGKVEGGKKDVERPSQEWAKLERTLSADLVFEKQHCDDSLVQCAGNEMQDHHDGTSGSMPEPLQNVKECEDCEKGLTSYVIEQNMWQDGSKVDQKHRGMRRRCLLFEEAASNPFESINGNPLPAHVPEDSISSAASSDSKDLKASHTALNATSREKQMVKLSKPITSLFSPPCSGDFPMSGTKPSGIGLHLNSIVNAIPHGPAALTGMRITDGCIGLQDSKSVTSLSCRNVENINKGLILSNLDGQSSVDTEDERHEMNGSITAGSFSSESPSFIEPPNLWIHVEHPAILHDERKLSSIDDGNFEDSDQTSPKKKKKKTSSTAGDNKRCNCKKSKCLKLYCDCFAAGLYCDEHCACQGCFNRKEYEDTVVEIRQQIESRNPLAFAPKIVPRAPDCPSNNMEDSNLTTPSSARHKRGCNCKKSTCMKKYCECYQANVGCSGACRCEGCKNVYGRKEDYIAMEHALSEGRVRNRVEEGSNSTFHNKPEMVAKKTDLLHGEFYDLHRLSPLTPSLQCSDHGKEAANFRAPSGKYFPAPESDVNVFPPHANFPNSPKNSESSLVILETEEMLRNGSYDCQLDCNNGEIMDQSSPRCNSISNVHHLTPLSNPPSMYCASLSSKTRDQTHIPHARLSQGSSRPVSGGSHRWRISPITPMTKVGETKYLQCLESDSRLCDILEDETTNMLKEASTPIKSVKARSPKQKRVSPPHGHLRELGSSSSVGLKSGRKFILKAVPSFPPLTPCSDSKGNGNEDSGTSISK